MLYENGGSGVFTLAVIDGNAPGASAIVAKDVDADGWVDLLAAVPDAGGGEVRLYLSLFEGAGYLPTSVPSLSAPALGLLAGLLAASGAAIGRRRRR